MNLWFEENCVGVLLSQQQKQQMLQFVIVKQVEMPKDK